MAVEIKFSINNPDIIDCNLSITMPLEDWKTLKIQLTNAHPSWKLQNAIERLIEKAEKEFNETEDYSN